MAVKVCEIYHIVDKPFARTFDIRHQRASKRLNEINIFFFKLKKSNFFRDLWISNKNETRSSSSVVCSEQKKKN